MFLAYASSRGQAFIDRELYLPEEWAQDEERRGRRITRGGGMRTKPELAKEMLRRALDAGVQAEWVVADCVYGDSRRLGMFLEEREQPYVLALSGKAHVWAGFYQHRVSGVLKLCARENWRLREKLEPPFVRGRLEGPASLRLVEARRSIPRCRKVSRDGFWCAAPSRIQKN